MKTAIILFILIAGFISMVPKAQPCDGQLKMQYYLRGKLIFTEYKSMDIAFRSNMIALETTASGKDIGLTDSVVTTISSPIKFNPLANWKQLLTTP